MLGFTRAGSGLLRFSVKPNPPCHSRLPGHNCSSDKNCNSSDNYGNNKANKSNNSSNDNNGNFNHDNIIVVIWGYRYPLG